MPVTTVNRISPAPDLSRKVALPVKWSEEAEMPHCLLQEVALRPKDQDHLLPAFWFDQEIHLVLENHIHLRRGLRQCLEHASSSSGSALATPLVDLAAGLSVLPRHHLAVIDPARGILDLVALSSLFKKKRHGNQALHHLHAVAIPKKTAAIAHLGSFRFREVDPIFKRNRHGFRPPCQSHEVVPSFTRSSLAARALCQSQEVVVLVKRLLHVDRAPCRRQEGHALVENVG
ncbi:hypothetical protein MMC17_002940 [Xylographa soralifera]|nr:hypothetical protein [Xylographa soralifera]